MPSGSLRISITWSALALCSGCAGSIGNTLADLDRYGQSVELGDVSFYPQTTDQCGPAALATILNSADMPVSAEELKPRVYLPAREGTLQFEMLGATRHYGRIPYLIDPNVGAILDELRSGRPVLVLQNLGSSLAPRWHYAVVVGYLPDERRFILRSGNEKRLLMSARSFSRTWQRADNWAFVALHPGELPAHATAKRYLRAVAAFESVDDTGDSIAAWRAATSEWPRNELAWLGLGNALYKQGDLKSAQSAYEKAIELEPGNWIAMNNLSQLQAELGCREDALSTINAALAEVAADEPMRRYLSDTLREIKQKSPTSTCL